MRLRHLPLRGSTAVVVINRMRFTNFTASRTGAVSGANWDAIVLDAEVRTVPAERIKSGKAHWVTLSNALVAVLKEMPQFEDGGNIQRQPRLRKR